MERTGLTGPQEYDLFVKLLRHTTGAKIAAGLNERFAVWANVMAGGWEIIDQTTGRGTVLSTAWLLEDVLSIAHSLSGAGAHDSRLTADQMRDLGLKPIAGINR